VLSQDCERAETVYRATSRGITPNVAMGCIMTNGGGDADQAVLGRSNGVVSQIQASERDH
jgi:hypothetical protein